MPEWGQGKNVGPSIWAVVAGFLAVVILSIGTDAGLHAAGIFPGLGQRMSDGLFVLATIYRTIYGVVGSYITARLGRFYERRRSDSKIELTRETTPRSATPKRSA